MLMQIADGRFNGGELAKHPLIARPIILGQIEVATNHQRNIYRHEVRSDR